MARIVRLRGPRENFTFLGVTSARAAFCFAAMKPGARTPEELETLLEDALVIRDLVAVAELFERESVVAIQHTADAARGGDIVRRVTELWASELRYLVQPVPVLQARDTALIVTERSINVAIRVNCHWHYAIALLDTNLHTTRPSVVGPPGAERT